MPSSSPSRNVDKAVLPQYNEVDTAVAGKIDALEAEVSQQQQHVNNVAKLPRIKCRNQRLAGKRHPKTGVLFTERVVTLGGQQYIVVAPEFDSAFDAQLPEELWNASDDVQFRFCTYQLRDMLLSNPEMKALFNEEQLLQINRGITPDDFTWHHDVEAGKMQLVLTEIHSKTGHTGGRSLWGGGKNYR